MGKRTVRQWLSLKTYYGNMMQHVHLLLEAVHHLKWLWSQLYNYWYLISRDATVSCADSPWKVLQSWAWGPSWSAGASDMAEALPLPTRDENMRLTFLSAKFPALALYPSLISTYILSAAHPFKRVMTQVKSSESRPGFAHHRPRSPRH